mmetsp:Transcript_24265/g.71420  ORF Transcript_24265/g.71420 Transcript_24265/m.71420 type:complete len:218 (+) Transcript_24265:221-874(+)
MRGCGTCSNHLRLVHGQRCTRVLGTIGRGRAGRREVRARGPTGGRSGASRHALRGNRALHFDALPMQLVHQLGRAELVHGSGGLEGDEAEAARLVRVWVKHDHAVHNLAPARKVGPELGFGGVVGEAAHEYFAHVHLGHGHRGARVLTPRDGHLRLHLLAVDHVPQPHHPNSNALRGEGDKAKASWCLRKPVFHHDAVHYFPELAKVVLQGFSRCFL